MALQMSGISLSGGINFTADMEDLLVEGVWLYNLGTPSSPSLECPAVPSNAPGTVRVACHPLVSTPPFAGNLSISFIMEPPVINYELRAANVSCVISAYTMRPRLVLPLRSIFRDFRGLASGFALLFETSWLR